jgi:hypothetical protein
LCVWTLGSVLIGLVACTALLVLVERNPGTEDSEELSVGVNKLNTREVKLISRTPQPNEAWCGRDHGKLRCGEAGQLKDATQRG